MSRDIVIRDPRIVSENLVGPRAQKARKLLHWQIDHAVVKLWIDQERMNIYSSQKMGKKGTMEGRIALRDRKGIYM